MRGLARAVERRGGRIAEGTAATSVAPGRVVTDRGTVRARVVIRATEGWTPQLPASRRDAVPVYSLMVATQPLPATFWDRAGLAAGETFADERHLIIYGQRTADGRLAFGGRGAPYHFGSRIDPAYDRVERVFTQLRRTLVDLFPDLAGYGFTHAWGGPLAIARDWTASVGLDPATGLGWAGDYVGDGVATTNLAGRTLADLVLGRRHGAHPAALGRSPVPALGAGAAAVAGAERGRPGGRRSRTPRSGSPAATASIARAMAPLLGE